MDFTKIEKKWQKRWSEKNAFEAKEDLKKKKFYCLEMFPYPSGSGLHMGHAFNYTIGDIFARFKRMHGLNVLYPMGYDAFGLPAENAAIKEGVHPKKYTNKIIENFIKQQKSLGLSYDWSKVLRTCEPEYYKWNQYFFLQFLDKGLIYRKKASVNWCLLCKSVLANEQVHQGKCWRHENTEVEIRNLEQWFIRTTEYADELLEDIEKLDWSERIKIMQRNWIGRSEGSEIIFKINGEDWKIFTTRPDTLFGVTFLVISAQHSELMGLVNDKQKKDVEEFLRKIKSTRQENIDQLDKDGVFTGSYAIHPLTQEKVPVYAGNFVIADYGSGMVMGVPAHDQRDFDFAKKYNIPIKLVVRKEGKIIETEEMKEAYIGSGILVSSGKFNGMHSEKAKEQIVEFLKKKGFGDKSVQYKLRDWLISRQRYWGTPIPIVYCDKCGIVPVPEKDLPVKLPDKVKFGEGNPLITNGNFLDVKCPNCKGKAKRETDTMDTFFDSSWYFFRYLDNKNNKMPFDSKKAKYWMPVDQYIGGAEHACMHLIYARFFTKALRDLLFLDIDEPFPKLFNQGMIHGEDGFVMSKSRGNVIDPMDVSGKYGVDALRFFFVFMGSPDKDSVWSSSGVEGSYKFLKKVTDYFENVKIGKSSKRVESKLNKAIKEISDYIESFKYNFAVIKLRSLFENMEREIERKDAESFIKLLAPFCPHVAEELWEKMGNKSLVSLAEWPEYDERKIDDKIEEAEKAFERTITDVLNVLRIVKDKSGKDAEKIYLYIMPFELEHYNAGELGKRTGKEVKVFAVNDKNKYDPENKAGKAKPGKPGIYVE